MDILGTTLEIEFLIWDPFVPETWNHGSVMGRMLLRRFFGHDDVTTLPLFCWILQSQGTVQKTRRELRKGVRRAFGEASII